MRGSRMKIRMWFAVRTLSRAYDNWGGSLVTRISSPYLSPIDRSLDVLQHWRPSERGRSGQSWVFAPSILVNRNSHQCRSTPFLQTRGLAQIKWTKLFLDSVTTMWSRAGGKLYSHNEFPHLFDLYSPLRLKAKDGGGENRLSPLCCNDCPLGAHCVETFLHAALMGKFTRVIASEPSASTPH